MRSGETASQSDFSSSEEDELNGTNLNRTIQGTSGGLQIKELIGRGAFGSVYKASWKGLPAAVKVHLVCYPFGCMRASYACMRFSRVIQHHGSCITIWLASSTKLAAEETAQAALSAFQAAKASPGEPSLW